MEAKYVFIHIFLCVILGIFISYFTDVNWLAASFWVSASLFVNGSFAIYEDALPGCFENPDGSETPQFAKWKGAIWYWLKSITIVVILIGMGILCQVYL